MKNETLTEFPRNTLVVYSPVRQIPEKRTFIVRDRTQPVHGIVLSKSLLGLLDIIASVFIVAPLVIGQWRGTWMLLSYYNVPWWLQKSVGVGLHVVFALARKPLQSFFTKTSMKIVRAVAVRIFIWVFGVACICHWQGTWIMLELYTRHRLGDVLGITFVSIALLSMLKALRNINTSPFCIVVDDEEYGLDFPTMFRTSGSRETALYVLDCLFSVVVIGTLVVFVWRGAWTLLDMYLYPDKPVISYWASLTLGYAIVLLTFSVQNPLKGLCSRIQGFWRVCVVDVYLFFSFCGTVNVWRGIWSLLNVYFLPEKPETSYWITHAGCLIILFLINCSNSILVRGVYIDAEEEGGKCVVFPCYYLRLFFQNKRKQKLQKQLQMLQAQQRVTVFPSSSTRCKTEDIQLNSANHHVISLQSMMDSEEKPLH